MTRVLVKLKVSQATFDEIYEAVTRAGQIDRVMPYGKSPMINMDEIAIERDENVKEPKDHAW